MHWGFLFWRNRMRNAPAKTGEEGGVKNAHLLAVTLISIFVLRIFVEVNPGSQRIPHR
jgi:hypothetical protein